MAAPQPITLVTIDLGGELGKQVYPFASSSDATTFVKNLLQDEGLQGLEEDHIQVENMPTESRFQEDRFWRHIEELI